MHSISEKTSGCIRINGQDYQVGEIEPKYIGTSTLQVTRRNNNRDIILKATFDQITDPRSGSAFVSMDALKAFVQANFFAEASEGGGVTEEQLDNGVQDAKTFAQSYADVKTDTLTVTQVRAISANAPAQLITKDFGGGTWYLDSADTSSTDNTGTILVTANGKRYKRPVGDFINVRWFGAKGDNTTNDAPAIQLAVNYFAGVGGTLLFPPGTYKITARIDILRSANVQKLVLKGSGAENTIIRMESGNNMTGATNNRIFNFSGFNSTSTVFDWSVSGFSFVGDCATDASAGNIGTGVGLIANGVKDGVISDCKFYTLLVGAMIVNGTNIDIVRCQAYNNLKFGIVYDSCLNSTIRDSRVFSNTIGGIRLGRFIGEAGNRNIIVMGNHVYDNKGSGIATSTDIQGVPTWNTNIRIQGNYCYQNYGSGILTSSLTDGCKVIGNTCYDNNYTPSGGNAFGKDGIHIETLSKNITVSENICYNTFFASNRGNICGIYVGEGSQIKTLVTTGITTGNTITVNNGGNWTLSPYFPPILTFEEVGYSSPYPPARLQDRSIFNGVTQIVGLDGVLIAVISSFVKTGEFYTFTLDRNITITAGTVIVVCVEPAPDKVTVGLNNCYSNRIGVSSKDTGLTHDQVFGVEIVPDIPLTHTGALNIVIRPGIVNKISANNFADVVIQ